MRKVCYRQTIVTSVRESKFSFAISKTHGGRDEKSADGEKRLTCCSREKKRERGRERKKRARESMGDGFIILPNVNSPTSFSLVPMGTKQGSLNVKKLIIRAARSRKSTNKTNTNMNEVAIKDPLSYITRSFIAIAKTLLIGGARNLYPLYHAEDEIVERI